MRSGLNLYETTAQGIRVRRGKWRTGAPGHYGLEQPKIQTAVLGHSLVRSLIRLHRSLVGKMAILILLISTFDHSAGGWGRIGHPVDSGWGYYKPVI